MRRCERFSDKSQVSESCGHREKSDQWEGSISTRMITLGRHTWDRPKDEVLPSKRVSLAIRTLRTRAVERGVLTHGAEMGIDGDWERGRVWFKKLRTIYRRPNSTSTELVYTGEIVPGWNEDFTALWNEDMEEANLRE